MFQNCMRLRCTAEAAYSIKALIPTKGCEFYETVPVEFYCGLKLCAACASRMKPHDLFSTDVKQSVRHVLREGGNHSSPDFDRAKLVLISINDLQLLQLEANHATLH